MKKQVVILLFVMIFIAMGYSLLAPLYPFMASDKNVNEAMVGIIFSAYALSNIFFIPFINSFIKLLGRRRLCYIAISICFSCSITFGILTYIQSHTLFIVISLINMFFEGIGIATMCTLTYSIAFSFLEEHEMEDNMGYLELAYSFGLSIGPLFGSFLYYLSGYSMAFFCDAAMILIAFGLISCITISDEANTTKVSFFTMLFNFDVFVTIIAIISGMISMSFIFPVFATHLEKKYGLTVEVTSIFFVFTIIGYFTAMKMLSCITRKIGNKLTMTLGIIVNMCSVLLLCPVSLFPQSLAVIIVGLSILGFGNVCIAVPGLIELVKILTSKLELSTQEANDNASALYNFAACLGEAFGPLLGGYITEHYTFQYACYSTSLINIIIAVLFSMINCRNIRKELGSVETKEDKKELNEDPEKDYQQSLAEKLTYSLNISVYEPTKRYSKEEQDRKSKLLVSMQFAYSLNKAENECEKRYSLKA